MTTQTRQLQPAELGLFVRAFPNEKHFAATPAHRGLVEKQLPPTGLPRTRYWLVCEESLGFLYCQDLASDDDAVILPANLSTEQTAVVIKPADRCFVVDNICCIAKRESVTHIYLDPRIALNQIMTRELQLRPFEPAKAAEPAPPPPAAPPFLH